MSFMYDPAGDCALAEALFASELQASDTVTAATIRAVVTATLTRHGVDGCAGLVAYEFGEHPEVAVRRMAWARRRVRDAFGESLQPA
ncbi:MAG TPA: hypothetical protein VES42_24185 [Pilimelia sp.]|nr:hypothetical protein [Pilimelia sp.]